MTFRNKIFFISPSNRLTSLNLDEILDGNLRSFFEDIDLK